MNKQTNRYTDTSIGKDADQHKNDKTNINVVVVIISANKKLKFFHMCLFIITSWAYPCLARTPPPPGFLFSALFGLSFNSLSLSLSLPPPLSHSFSLTQNFFLSLSFFLTPSFSLSLTPMLSSLIWQRCLRRHKT
jgi:hypothetical protein